MKHKLHGILKGLLIAAAAIISLTTIVSSCTKTPSSNDAAKFAGTWTGTTSCGGGASSFTLTQTNNTTLTETGSVGSGSCLKSTTLSHTASGSTLTVPAQTFTDNCGNSYTISGAGSLSGSILTLTETVSGAVSETCTFTGQL